MWVRRLQLVDFRSYHQVEFAAAPGPVVLVGPNGQGKTNLVEAVAFAATLSSHRTAQDAALVRVDAPRSVVRVEVMTGERATTVELELNQGGSNRAQVNGQPVTRMRDVVGHVRCCVFAPEHLRHVKGDPADRRRYLDDVMVQAAPRYLAVRSDFDRALRQRNAALRSLAAAPSSEAEAVLAAWDERYVPAAADLTWGRLNATRQLAEPVARAYREISPAPDRVSVAYQSSAGPVEDVSARDQLADALRAELRRLRRDEVRRGVTLAGPHRDDLVLELDGRPARTYASHGESWSLALALQLAAFSVLHEIAGDPPVLILDDVFAELDEQRRARLLSAITAAEQVFVTAAVQADVPAALTGHAIAVTKHDGVSNLGSGDARAESQPDPARML